MFTQHFIIEGKYLGQATRQISLSSKGIGRPESYQFYCQLCGHTFAQCPVVDDAGRQQIWLALRVLCRKCRPPYQSLVPGSLWLSWDSEFVAAFPDAVLRWEFDRHLEWYERKLDGQ